MKLELIFTIMITIALTAIGGKELCAQGDQGAPSPAIQQGSYLNKIGARDAFMARIKYFRDPAFQGTDRLEGAILNVRISHELSKFYPKNFENFRYYYGKFKNKTILIFYPLNSQLMEVRQDYYPYALIDQMPIGIPCPPLCD